VCSVGAADHISSTGGGGRDEVYVEGVELGSDQAELLRQVREQLGVGSSSQLVYELANRAVVERSLLGQSSSDRRRLNVVRVEQRREVIEEPFDLRHVVDDAAEAVQRVSHELHASDVCCEAVESRSIGRKLKQLEVLARRLADRCTQDRCVEADEHSGAAPLEDLRRQILVRGAG
jgi:hypothetical protein